MSPGTNYNQAYKLNISYEIGGETTNELKLGQTVTPGTNSYVVNYSNSELYSLSPVKITIRVRAKDQAGNLLDTALESEPTIVYTPLISQKDDEFGWRWTSASENNSDYRNYYQSTEGNTLWVADNRSKDGNGTADERQRIIGVTQGAYPNWYARQYTASSDKLGGKIASSDTAGYKVDYHGCKFWARKGTLSGWIFDAIRSQEKRLTIYWNEELTDQEFVTKTLDKYFAH